MKRLRKERVIEERREGCRGCRDCGVRGRGQRQGRISKMKAERDVNWLMMCGHRIIRVQDSECDEAEYCRCREA